MSQAFFAGNNAALGTSAATTYNGIVGRGDGGWTANPVRTAMVCAAAGKFKNLRVILTAAPGAGDTRTFSLAIGASPVASALTVAFGAADTDLTDSTHEVTVAAGDVLTFQHVSTGTPNAASAQWSMEFVPDSATDCIYGGSQAQANPSAAAQNFTSLLAGAGGTWSATEVNHSCLIPCAATITSFYLLFETTVVAGSWLCQIYKNGAAETSSNITVTTGTTGSVTGLSIAVVAGDLLSLSFTPTSTPTTGRIATGIGMTAGTSGESIVCGGTTDSPSNAATQFQATWNGQRTDSWSATEAQWQALCGVTGFDLRDMRVTFATAPGVGNSFTYELNVDGSASALSILIADAATSGTDASTVSVVAGNLLSMASTPVSSPTVPGLNKWAMVQFIAPAATGRVFTLVGAGGGLAGPARGLAG